MYRKNAVKCSVHERAQEEYESTIQRALVFIMNHKRQQQANRMSEEVLKL